MKRLLFRFVSLLLIPFLIGNSVPVDAVFPCQIHIAPQNRSLFNEQALLQPNVGAQYPWYLSIHERVRVIQRLIGKGMNSTGFILWIATATSQIVSQFLGVKEIPNLMSWSVGTIKGPLLILGLYGMTTIAFSMSYMMLVELNFSYKGSDLETISRQKAARAFDRLKAHFLAGDRLKTMLSYAAGVKPGSDQDVLEGNGKDYNDHTVLYSPWMVFWRSMFRYNAVRRGALGLYFDAQVAELADQVSFDRSWLLWPLKQCFWHMFAAYEGLKYSYLYPLMIPWILLEGIVSSSISSIAFTATTLVALGIQPRKTLLFLVGLFRNVIWESRVRPTNLDLKTSA